MLTARQHALLRVARSRLGLGDDDYRALLEAHAGVRSSREMDVPGFQRVLHALKGLGFVYDRDANEFGARAGMASPAQVRTIRGLWAGWAGANDDAALGKWLETSFGVSALRFLSAASARKAIEALKAMNARRRAAAG